METTIKQGGDFLKREARRVQNLLKGKVKKSKFLCKLDDDNRHANAEGIILDIYRKFFIINIYLKSLFVEYFDMVSIHM